MNRIIAIIPNFNGGEALRDCIESLRDQSEKLEAIIVVDNCSSDRRFIELGDRLFESRTNWGYGTACNFGAKIAFEHYNPEYLLFLNCDTILGKACVSLMTSHLEMYPKYAGVCPFIRSEASHTISYSGAKIYRTFNVLLYDRKARENTHIIETDYLCGAAMTIRAKAFKQHFFSMSYFMYYEDADLSVRLTKSGWKLGVVPVCAYHDPGKLSTTAQKFWWRFKNGFKFMFRNNPVWLWPTGAVGHTFFMLYKLLKLKLS